jgi:hypothetical protein
VRALEALPWVIITAGILVALIAPQADTTPVGEFTLMICLALFFTALLAQLATTARRAGRRRTPLMLLGIGLCLWATGSTVLQAAAATSTISFPTPGETFFLLSYLGFAAFLLTDAPRRHAASSTIWLETAVVCGATICAASFVVLTPVALAFDRTGMPLLLALLYPMVDLALATLVISQMMLGQRDRSMRTLQLVGGFLLLAAADSSFLLTLSQDFYFSSLLLSSLWGASLVLIVTAGRTRPGELQASQVPKDQSRTLVLAAAVATGVLLLDNEGVVGAVIVVTALVTLSRLDCAWAWRCARRGRQPASSCSHVPTS